MVLWERESLLLSFAKWKKYTRLKLRNVETVALCLGINNTLRYYFKRWNEIKKRVIEETNHEVIIKQKSMKHIFLLLRFSKWFRYSCSRGQRLRILRKRWDHWLDNITHQKQERQVYGDLVHTILLSRKAELITQWQRELNRIKDHQNNQKRVIEQCRNLATFFILSQLCCGHSKPLLTRSWYIWRSIHAETSHWHHHVEENCFRHDRLKNDKRSMQRDKSLSHNEPKDKIKHIYDNTSQIKRSVVSKKAREIAVKQSDYIQSIACVNDKEVQKNIAERNIAVQRRTLIRYQQDIDNYQCTCNGSHLSTNHECKHLKMKQRVFTYLQESLKESNSRLKELNDSLDREHQKKRISELTMIESLMLYNWESCL